MSKKLAQIMRKSDHRHAYRQASLAHYDTSLILHLFDSVLIQGSVYKNYSFWIGLICFSKQNMKIMSMSSSLPPHLTRHEI